MKLTSLLSTIALLLFAGTAAAQSDPSTGGSFGTSFNHNAVSGGAMAGTALIGQDASMTAPPPTQRSFWDRITGRNRPAAQAHRGKSSFRSNTQAQSTKRSGAAKMKTSSSATSTPSNRWRLFGKK